MDVNVNVSLRLRKLAVVAKDGMHHRAVVNSTVTTCKNAHQTSTGICKNVNAFHSAQTLALPTEHLIQAINADVSAMNLQMWDVEEPACGMWKLVSVFQHAITLKFAILLMRNGISEHVAVNRSSQNANLVTNGTKMHANVLKYSMNRNHVPRHHLLKINFDM